MKKFNFLKTCLTTTMILFASIAFGQSTALGKYNLKEADIQGNIWKEYNKIGSSTSTGDSPEEAIKRLKNYLSKAKASEKKTEQNMARYIQEEAKIPESSEYKSNNADYKHYSKSLIEEYESMLRTIRLQIKYAEEQLAFNESEILKKAQQISPEKGTEMNGTTEQNSYSAATTENQTSEVTTSPKDQGYVSASNFQGGLGNIREGDYFINSDGDYFRKSGDGAIKVSKAEYDKAEIEKYNATLAKQEADRQKQMKINEDAAAGISDVAMQAYNTITAVAEANREREYRSRSEANEILTQYKPLAEKGNTEALNKVYSAYQTLAYYNGEAKEFYTGSYSAAREQFLQNTLENTNSEHARGLLYSHYQNQKETLLDTKRRFLGNGILSTIFGSGIIYAGAIGSAAVREKVEEYVPGTGYVETSEYDPTMEAVSVGTAVVGIGLGGYLAVRGLIRLGTSLSLGRNHSTIKQADEKINKLKEKYSLKWSSGYNMANRGSMLGLTVTF